MAVVDITKIFLYNLVGPTFWLRIEQSLNKQSTFFSEVRITIKKTRTVTRVQLPMLEDLKKKQKYNLVVGTKDRSLKISFHKMLIFLISLFRGPTLNQESQEVMTRVNVRAFEGKRICYLKTFKFVLN